MILSPKPVAEGLHHRYIGGSDWCRDPSDLDNNNVYVRSRCNNNWCAHVYAYYFQKDVAHPYTADPRGQRHDWEHIVVFVEGGNDARMVAVSQHARYKTRDAADVRWFGDHPKCVYHKFGGSTHGFRFAYKGDDKIENCKGDWFVGPLVDYHTGFPGNTRDILMNHDFGGATIAIKNETFEINLNKARKHGAPASFESGWDE